jgi:DHA2 family multidrug resistance protein
MAESTGRIPPGVEATPAVLQLYARFGPGYRWWVAAVTVIGSFATLLTSTIVNVAIPDIMGSLGLTLDQAQWLVAAFLAAGTVTMLITAWCIRAFGVANTYVMSMLVFVAGSLLGATAQTAEMMFTSRIIQGAGAGLVMPISMVMISQVFPTRQRGMAMGLMGVGTILAPALGPTLGGYLVDNLSWRWVFVMAIPFVVASIPLAMTFLPQRENHGARPPFDWVGTLLCSGFIVALLLGMAGGQRHGWYDESVLLILAVGVVTFAGWVAWELRFPDPMLQIRLFLNPQFVAAAIVTFTVGIGLYGSTYVFPLFLQQISLLTATDAGLLMAPGGLAMALLFPVAGWLADVTSVRRMILAGLIIFAVSNLPMLGADINMPAFNLLMWYVLGRIGLACIFPSLNAAAINPLPLSLIPDASGAVNFLRQLGGAFGISIISMSMNEQLALHRDTALATQTWDNSTTMELMRLAQEQFTYFGIIGYRSFEASFGYVISAVSSQASMLAYRDAFGLISVIFVVTLIPAWFLAKGRERGKWEHSR